MRPIVTAAGAAMSWMATATPADPSVVCRSTVVPLASVSVSLSVSLIVGFTDANGGRLPRCGCGLVVSAAQAVEASARRAAAVAASRDMIGNGCTGAAVASGC